MKVLNYNIKNEMDVIDLIHIFSDISNLFTEINNYNKDFYVINKISYNDNIKNCENKICQLSELMYKVKLTHYDYLEYKRNIDNMFICIYHLRRTVEKELTTIQSENDKLLKSILEIFLTLLT